MGGRGVMGGGRRCSGAPEGSGGCGAQRRSLARATRAMAAGPVRGRNRLAAALSASYWSAGRAMSAAAPLLSGFATVHAPGVAVTDRGGVTPADPALAAGA